MEQILTPLEVVIVIAALVLTFVIIWRIGIFEAKKVHKVYGSAVYARLCLFADFVNKCSITVENYNHIQEDLRIIQGLKEMEDYVFSHKVKEVVKNFERRFKQWIPTPDQLRRTN